MHKKTILGRLEELVGYWEDKPQQIDVIMFVIRGSS